MKTCHIKPRNKGFTLVEVILILGIIAILSTLAISSVFRYLDKVDGTSAISYARQAYTASNWGLAEWKSNGSKGNGDKAFKINIELETIKFWGLTGMSSYTQTFNPENSVQVALSLPSYFSQGWDTFISDCKEKNLKNYTRIWIGKKSNGTVEDVIKAIYYVSADGKYASRIVYDSTTKLGSVDQRAGTYYEKIN